LKENGMKVKERGKTNKGIRKEEKMERRKEKD
jgi:hypothetical protein